MKTLLLFILLFGSVVAADTFPVVEVINGKPLTNATILRATERGISFKCDQGLVQVTYDKLPESFASYRPAPKEPATKETAKESTASSSRTQKPAPKEPTAAERASAAKAKQDLRDKLTNLITRYEETIRRYETQSGFAPGKKVTLAEYETARKGREDAKRQLAELN